MVQVRPQPRFISNQTWWLAAFSNLLSLFRGRTTHNTIARLKCELESREATIREQAIALAHSQKIFDRSSAVAKIGVWQCNLHDNALVWTDTVYDIFDLPRGSKLDRSRIVDLYVPESAQELDRLRREAIEARGGFRLDAEIITAKGMHRWMRITATVECEDGVPVRIFGMKQDITDEKIMSDRMRYLANFDAMTGLANRARFQEMLSTLSGSRRESDPTTALLLIDLDGFKTINDSFGHAAGDDCLKETASILKQLCSGADLIARVGGDEFAIVATTWEGIEAITALAAKIVEGLNRPVVQDERKIHLGASIGITLAGASAPTELFKMADDALYQAKAAGRNTYRMVFPSLDAACDGARTAA